MSELGETTDLFARAVGGDTEAVEVAARGADRGQREGCDQPKEAQKDDADDAQDAGDQPDRLGGDVDLDGWVCGERRIGIAFR